MTTESTDTAVLAAEYEKAAQLRDRIKEFERNEAD